VLEDYFIIQQCAPKNITVGMKITRGLVMSLFKESLKSKKKKKHYFLTPSFSAVFGRMIQSLFKEKRIDGSGENGSKFFPRFIWRLCILHNVFLTSKKPDRSALFPTLLKELSTNKLTLLKK
jgi:hypothetical protein